LQIETFTVRTSVSLAGHTHDDRYYTESEVNSLLAGKQAAGTYNTIIGTDSDINTSGSTIIDNIYVTDGVITSMGTRTLTAADIGAQPAGSYLTTSGKAADANLLDGINSSQFLRSDTNDTVSPGRQISFQWRVVTGGSERLEVNNSATKISQNLDVNGRVYASNGVDIESAHIYVDSEHGFENSGAWTRNKTPYGYIDLGPANTSHAHIYTDRPNFYFNKSIQVLGQTVVLNNDSRLSDARTPTSHTHDDRYYTESEANSRFLNVTGDTMTGAISMTTGASTHPGNSTPTALSYGKLTGYGSFFINADTDGSTTEYLYLTAGYGAGSTDGMRIGHATNSLTWKGQKVWNGHNLTFALSGSQLTITTS